MRVPLAYLLLAGCLAAAGCTGWAYKVVTPNMMPTIKVGDTCVIDKFAYRSNPVGRFDIVVFNAPDEVEQMSGAPDGVKIIKRVIGLPGETVEIKENVIFINGSPLNEPFEKLTNDQDPGRNFQLITIPADEYFILGDNRPGSFDSRFWKHATIRRADILGKVDHTVPAG